MALLTALGYAYVPLVLCMLLSGLAALIYFLVATRGKGGGLLVQVLAALLIATCLIGRAMWVRVQPPHGEKLHPSESPELFKLLAAMRQQLKAVKVHQVLITPELNAAIAEVPRLGMLGWSKNYLVLGLSLMETLSPDQFRAVLAHELAHLSARHGRLSVWVYRVREVWTNLSERVNASGIGKWVYLVFSRWYAPCFNAYTFVLMRATEIEADRLSVSLTSGASARSALLRLTVISRYHDEEYWREFGSMLKEFDQPPDDIYVTWLGKLRSGFELKLAQSWIRDALNRASDPFDSHPSLSERLAAIDAVSGGTVIEDEEAVRALSGPSAAEVYLSEARERLIRKFSTAWLEQLKTRWSEDSQSVRSMNSRLAELKSIHAQGNITPELNLELAQLTMSLEGDQTAKPVLQAIVDRSAAFAPAHFELGCLLLRNGESTGLEHLEKAMQLDSLASLPALEAAIEFLNRAGRHTERREFIERYDAAARLHELARQERNNFSKDDELRPFPVEPEYKAALSEIFIKYPEVKFAYIAEKMVKHMPEHRCIVVAAIYQTSFWRLETEKRIARVTSGIVEDFASIRDNSTIFILPRRHALLIRKVKDRGTLVFDRKIWKRHKRRSQR